MRLVIQILDTIAYTWNPEKRHGWTQSRNKNTNVREQTYEYQGEQGWGKLEIGSELIYNNMYKIDN